MWKTYKIGDICEVIGGGTPSTKDDTNFGGNIPWITPRDLTNHRSRYIQYGERNITEKGLRSSSARILPKGTILLSSRAPVGYLAIAENELCTNQGFRSLIVKEGFHNEFIYYLLLANVEYLKSQATGTTFLELSGNVLKSLEFPIPPLAEQRAIAEMLGSLDDKIEANRRENETLEATTRAIFKSWFVDFDPVHAKSRGELPVGMDEETAQLFPDGFVESELGLIPQGWRVEPIGNHVKASKGLSYKGDYLVDSIEDGIPMHNLNSIYEWGTYKFDGIKFYSGDYQARHEVQAGDLIVANTEQGFNLLLIASPAIIPSVFGNKGIISHHVYKINIKLNSPVTRLFLYYQIMIPPFRDVLQGYTNGTTVNMLPADAFETPLLVVPIAELTHKFDLIITPMLEQIEKNYKESNTLVETRDALLPKLVSGEVRA